MGRAATVYSDILDGGSGRLHCQLVVVDGPDRGRACRLAEHEVTIGTAHDCDLTLSDDRVSAHHVAIHAAESRFAIRDLDSTNGTWYEGSRVTEVTVPAGSTLLVGRSALRIEPEAQPLDLPPSQARRFGELVGESLAMREVFMTELSINARRALSDGSEGARPRATIPYRLSPPGDRRGNRSKKTW